MKKIQLLLFLFLSTHLAYSQTNYAVADSIASHVKGDDLISVHKALTAKLSTDEEKVRAFYFWIAQNINYDVLEWQRADKSSKKQEPASVMKLKKGVCHGYSSLFLAFCRLSNIPCYMISGFTRMEEKLNTEGHAWNIVFVNGKWQQVDATWGAGHVSAEKKYKKEFTEEFFLSDPVNFLSMHYPHDPMWQLVFYPVKMADYKSSRWNYTEKTTPYFTFNDTIARWERLDSLEREYVAALRMLRFSPDEPVVKLHLSYALMDKGDAEFAKGNQLMTRLYPPGKTIVQQPVSASDRKYKIAQLDSIDTFYKNADAFYNQVELTDASEKAVLKNNIKALNFNRDVVKEEKKYLTK